MLLCCIVPHPYPYRAESEEEGLVLEGEIGMRLKAMEYWRCAEVGLAAPSATLEDSELKMVIAEPLKGFGNFFINFVWVSGSAIFDALMRIAYCEASDFTRDQVLHL